MSRTQSPSSINTFRQCPRKYFYQYILKLPTKPSIHLVRGSIVHTVLENFFNINPEQLSKINYPFEMKTILLDNLRKEWEANKEEFDKLDMNAHDVLFYYKESQNMLENWLKGFLQRLHKEQESKNFIESFNYLKPITEKKYHSETYRVQGFIDAIHEFEDGVHIFDYKTSKSDHLNEAYQLQLAIYALLYKIEHGILPKRVGINFLKFGEKYLTVDETLVEEAKTAIVEIHRATKTTDKADYPKHISGLCKWSTGQCDFYETCIKDD